jgi:hypothetical protein
LDLVHDYTDSELIRLASSQPLLPRVHSRLGSRKDHGIQGISRQDREGRRRVEEKDRVEFYTVSYSQDSRIDDIDLFSEY